MKIETMKRHYAHPLANDTIAVFTLEKEQNITLPEHQAEIYVHDDYCRISFAAAHKALSSAILNGGMTTIEHVLNQRVDGESPVTEAADVSLHKQSLRLDLHGKVLAMMTAASMNSVRIAQAQSAEVMFTVCISCGLSNARCAGDLADIAESEDQHSDHVGTINIILLVNHVLSDAAMVEAVMMVTEAKATALQQLGVKSLVSDQLATGTGTDSTAVICPVDDVQYEKIAFVGKHLHLGQQLANAVICALSSTAAYELGGQ